MIGPSHDYEVELVLHVKHLGSKSLVSYCC
jgi:hypothetical protein